MAVLVAEHDADATYEVRTAGRTRRLYVDGVLHTQFNPQRLFTGDVWDLLLLPALASQPSRVRRVLLLGLGGGAVVHALRRFVGPQQIVAVEKSAVLLRLARQYFGLEGKDLALARADAVGWVRAYRGPPFDLIIDDLFGGNHGQPERAVHADGGWMAGLTDRLARRGTLVVNFVSPAQMRGCGVMQRPTLRRRYATGCCLTTGRCENAVAAFFRAPVTASCLRSRVFAHALLSSRAARAQLQFRAQTLWQPIAED